MAPPSRRRAVVRAAVALLLLVPVLATVGAERAGTGTGTGTPTQLATRRPLVVVHHAAAPPALLPEQLASVVAEGVRRGMLEYAAGLAGASAPPHAPTAAPAAASGGGVLGMGGSVVASVAGFIGSAVGGALHVVWVMLDALRGDAIAKWLHGSESMVGYLLGSAVALLLHNTLHPLLKHLVLPPLRWMYLSAPFGTVPWLGWQVGGWGGAAPAEVCARMGPFRAATFAPGTAGAEDCADAIELRFLGLIASAAAALLLALLAYALVSRWWLRFIVAPVMREVSDAVLRVFGRRLNETLNDEGRRIALAVAAVRAHEAAQAQAAAAAVAAAAPAMPILQQPILQQPILQQSPPQQQQQQQQQQAADVSGDAAPLTAPPMPNVGFARAAAAWEGAWAPPLPQPLPASGVRTRAPLRSRTIASATRR